MTSTFAGDFDFGSAGPWSTSKHDEETPEGMEELFLFSPWTQSGEVTFFNWLNADQSGYDGVEGWEDSGHQPGWYGNAFSKLPANAEWATEKPQALHGKNAAKSPDKIFVTGPDKIPDLFRHTYNDRIRWELCWRGYYQKGSGKKWLQYFNAAVYNTTDVLYPFATKGVSFRMRVPSGVEETYVRGKGDDDNYGNHLIINRAHGLWRDLEGKYYSYRLRCHGDNRYKAYGKSDGDGTEEAGGEEGGKVRPEKGSGKTANSRYTDRVKPQTIGWWGDRYWFLDQDNIPVETTDDALEKNMIKKGAEKGIIMFTTENVENLFFCGFSLELHQDRSAGSKRNHSYLISRLTPVPFYAPRHTPNIKAVLGEPTPLSELKQGHKKIHMWNPPNTYYQWVDNLQYDENPPIEDSDTITGDGDTIWANIDEEFVNEEGEGVVGPTSLFMSEDNRIIINSKGEVLTTDGSDYVIDRIEAEYKSGEYLYSDMIPDYNDSSN